MPKLKSKQKEKKYRKRAHGTGTVTELKGNRRKRFIARLSATRDVTEGGYSQPSLGTFKTYEEACKALDLYYFYQQKEISKKDIKKTYPSIYDSISKFESTTIPTFAKIYQILRKERFECERAVASKDSWFNNLTQFHNRKINTITYQEMQSYFDEMKSNVSYDTLAHMKSLLKQIYKYAVRYEFIEREENYIQDIDITISKSINQKEKKTSNPFNELEIKQLIACDTFAAKTVLLFVYTGCRPNELIYLDRSNIFLGEETVYNGKKQIIDYLITGSKTEAGLNRFVPIHPFIKPIIKWFLENYDYKTLFMPDNTKGDWITYYRNNIFKEAMSMIENKHIPYDCRHTFITLAEEYDLNLMAKKRIVGHKMGDITYDVYTHSVKNKLYNEICKIPSL